MEKKTKLSKVFHSISLQGFAEYIGVAPETVSRWDDIPEKYYRKTIEYIEIVKDDLFELVDLFEIKRNG